MKKLADYKTFTNIEGLNDAVRQHIYAYKFDLNATALRTLETVSRYAVKYTGAAWLKIDTLAAIIKKSPATTRRALATLERLGIIERVSFMREVRGGNGGNIIRVLPAKPTDDCPQMIARKTHTDLTESSVKPSVPAAEALDLYKKPIQTIKRTLPAAEKSPATFYEHLKSLISDKKERREYYIAFKKQVATLLKFDIYADKADLLELLAVRALYSALRRQQGGNVGNAVGYFYGTLRNQIEKTLFSDVSEAYSADIDELLALLPY